MSDAAAAAGVDAEGGPRLFGLAASDARLLEEICGELLHSAGVDGTQFFDRLKAGEPIGAALGLPPEINELIYERAHRWFVAGRPEKAEPLFRALCAADARTPDYWVGLGICLRLKGDYAGASLAFSTASRVRPDWAVPAFHAAELALQRRDRAAAETEIRRFRRLSDSTTPDRMTGEVARMEQALAAQSQQER